MRLIKRCVSLLLASTILANSLILPMSPQTPKEEPFIFTMTEPAEKPIQLVEEEIDIEPIVVETVAQQEIIVEEPTTEEVIVEEVFVPQMSDEEIDLIALVTMAEAEGECEEGKRLVIDVILNRIDSERFPNSATDVIYAPHQFSSMWNGRSDRCYVMDDIRQLVIEELESRTNSEVLYFRMSHYHNFGTPITQVGNHYFSGV